MVYFRKLLSNIVVTVTTAINMQEQHMQFCKKGSCSLSYLVAQKNVLFHWNVVTLWRWQYNIKYIRSHNQSILRIWKTCMGEPLKYSSLHFVTIWCTISAGHCKTVANKQNYKWSANCFGNMFACSGLHVCLKVCYCYVTWPEWCSIGSKFDSPWCAVPLPLFFRTINFTYMTPVLQTE